MQSSRCCLAVASRGARTGRTTGRRRYARADLDDGPAPKMKTWSARTVLSSSDFAVVVVSRGLGHRQNLAVVTRQRAHTSGASAWNPANIPTVFACTVQNTQGLEYDSEAVTETRDWERGNPNCRLAPLSWLALPSETETSIDENGLSSVEATIRVSAWRISATLPFGPPRLVCDGLDV